MTKYYFVSYIYRDGVEIKFASCTMQVIDKTINEIIRSIARLNYVPKEDVTLFSMKDLSEEEYKMLKGDDKLTSII